MPGYQKILQYARRNIIEEEFYGCILNLNHKRQKLFKIGEIDNICYRSCAKPLQLSILFDLDLDKLFTDQQIAIMTSSHSATYEHIKIVDSILKKFNLNEDNLLCPATKPICEKTYLNLVKNNKPYNKLHNNCSGKHAFFLVLSKLLGYSIDNYCDFNHPIQVLIKNKLLELCEINDTSKWFEFTKDGCLAPIISSGMENLCIGFLNLFLNKKYDRLKNIFINYPDLIGGENRLDTLLMSINKNIIAKNGACGLICILHLVKREVLLIKMSNSDLKSRAMVTKHVLLEKEWLKKNDLEHMNKYKIFNNTIETLNGEIVGKIKYINKEGNICQLK